MTEIRDLFLEKILYLTDGKINAEINIIESTVFSYDFKFEIEETNPKSIEFSVE